MNCRWLEPTDMIQLTSGFSQKLKDKSIILNALAKAVRIKTQFSIFG
jgi:hypothetical protein